MSMEQIIANLDEEQIQQIQQQIDPEQIHALVESRIDEDLGPHLVEVRERCHEQPDPKEIRQEFANASPQKQQQLWNAAVGDVIEVFHLLREDPEAALRKAKDLLRNPYTSEALLLIFHNDQHIDDDYGWQMKDYGANLMAYLGTVVAPEMYSPEEIEAVHSRIDLDVEDAEQ